jgi:hypothetical protein
MAVILTGQCRPPRTAPGDDRLQMLGSRRSGRHRLSDLSAIFENRPRRSGLLIAGPSLRLKKLPHRPLQRHRNHRHRRAADDALHARAEGIELAAVGDLAFREDRHQFARGERRATSSKAASIIAASSFAGAIGIACMWRKTKLISGVR